MTPPLGADPGNLSFFQTVREILRSRAAGEADASGEDPELEPSRATLCAHPSMAFPAAEIRQVRSEGGGAPPEVLVSFLGVAGVLGVLPPHYTSLVIRRARERDTALRDFLDLFHHRLLTLYYRAWAKYRLPVLLEQTGRGGAGADVFTGQLLCLLGLGTEQLRRRLPLDGCLLLLHGGHFARHVRPAGSLQQLLNHVLGVPVAVQEFQSSWLELSPADQSRLSGRLGDGHCTLGGDLVLGERVWDCQGGFRVRLGPLPWAQFAEFLPGRPRRALLQSLTRQFVGGALQFDLQLLLHGDQVPPCRLAVDDPPPLLGWCSWLGGREPARVAEESILPEHVPVASKPVS